MGDLQAEMEARGNDMLCCDDPVTSVGNGPRQAREVLKKAVCSLSGMVNRPFAHSHSKLVSQNDGLLTGCKIREEVMKIP
jgi:hypothetical protein